MGQGRQLLDAGVDRDPFGHDDDEGDDEFLDATGTTRVEATAHPVVAVVAPTATGKSDLA